ncbi:MAG TPA: methyltransferase domain-containing protein [Actinocatenispora sp.]
MAESFGVDAERYDRARPPYPDDLIAGIVTGSPGADVLDVGCGTGIASRQLRAAGCTVLGVEPDARMAEFARRDGLDVEVGTFEEWEPAGRDFDALVAATAWHWVDPAAGPAKAARVLRPGGRFAAFWHAFQLPDAVTDAFATAYQRAVPDSPIAFRSAGRQGLDLYQPMLDKTAGELRATGAFDDAEQWRFEWTRTYGRDEWLEQLSTQGGLTPLRPEQARDILAAVGAAIDGLGGTFTMPYATVTVTATRTA